MQQDFFDNLRLRLQADSRCYDFEAEMQAMIDPLRVLTEATRVRPPDSARELFTVAFLNPETYSPKFTVRLACPEEPLHRPTSISRRFEAPLHRDTS